MIPFKPKHTVKWSKLFETILECNIEGHMARDKELAIMDDGAA